MDTEDLFEDSPTVYPDACPACRSAKVLAGHLHGKFHLRHTKSFTLALTGPDINTAYEAYVCWECGLVWSVVNRQAMRQMVLTWSKDSVKDQLSSLAVTCRRKTQ